MVLLRRLGELESWQRNLAALWLGVLICNASYSMVVPFLPLFLLKIGLHRDVTIWSGVMFSSTFLMSAIISPYWGALSDRYGRRPMILRSGISLCLAYVATALVQTPLQLLILRSVQGLLSGYIPSSIALIGTSTPARRVGYALSLVATASAAGGIIGPLLGGTVSNLFGMRTAFAAAGALMLAATLLALFFVREEGFAPAKERSSVARDLREAFANPSFTALIGLALLVNFSIMTIEPILPLYIVELGGSLESASLLAGVVFSLVGIASVIFAPRWGRAADRMGFARVLGWGLVGGGIGNLLQLPFHSLVPFALVRFGYGVFFCAVFPAINGLVVQVTRPEFRGRAFGLQQSAGQIGTMLGPLVGGFLSAVWGVHGVFWVTGGLLLLAAALAWRGRQSWALSPSGAVQTAAGIAPPSAKI